MNSDASNNYDVNRLLDGRNWSPYQMFLIACTALTIILDGIDNSMLGLAVPDLMKEWGRPRGDFATALAMSPFGMLIGGVLGGWIGDLIGRKTALLWSVLLFAIPTALIYYANDITSLCIFRFLAGLGLGGAMPSATALATEFVPKRQKAFAVTLTIVSVPVGAMLAAELSGHLIPLMTWRGFFLVGGILPFLMGLALFAVLPESPRFLATRPHRWPELSRLLRKMGFDLPQNATFHAEQPAPATPTRPGEVVSYASPAPPRKSNAIGTMFAPGMLGDTLFLFGSFFFGLLVAYLVLQLFVTALTSAGFSAFDARRTLFWWNVGGVVGAIVGSLVIRRYGSKPVMTAFCVLAVVSSFGIAALPLQKVAAANSPASAPAAATLAGPATSIVETNPSTTPAQAAVVTPPAPAAPAPSQSLNSPLGIALIILCIVMGIATNTVQVAMYALAANVYPIEIRGTGIGITVAVGRIGNILASYIGTLALQLGISYYFGTAAVGMALVLVFLLFIRRHIDRTPPVQAPAFEVVSADKGK